MTMEINNIITNECEKMVAVVDFERAATKRIIEGILMAATAPLKIEEIVNLLNSITEPKQTKTQDLDIELAQCDEGNETSQLTDVIESNAEKIDELGVECSLKCSLNSSPESIEVDNLDNLKHPNSSIDPDHIKKYSFKINDVESMIQELIYDYSGRGIELKEIASGFRFQVSPDLGPWIHKLFEQRPPRYSRALMETLALIAYKQPITRAEIEDVRGVSVSSNIIKTLIEHEWIRVIGHKEVPGKPELFATTDTFLDHFNIKSLAELPELMEFSDKVDETALPNLNNEKATNIPSDI